MPQIDYIEGLTHEMARGLYGKAHGTLDCETHGARCVAVITRLDMPSGRIELECKLCRYEQNRIWTLEDVTAGDVFDLLLAEPDAVEALRRRLARMGKDPDHA